MAGWQFDLRKLKALKRNRELKKLLAELILDTSTLKEMPKDF
jgi:hypothetical protein